MTDLVKAATSPDLFMGSYMDAYKEQLMNQKVQQETQKLIEEAYRNSQMLPYDIDYKEAMTRQANAVADNYGRDKIDPLKKAQASAELERLLTPRKAAYLASKNYKKLYDDPEMPQYLKDLLMSAENDDHRSAILRENIGYGPIDKAAAGRQSAEIRAGAVRNNAEIRAWETKYRTDAMERIAQLKASAEKQGKPLSHDQAYTMIVLDDLQNGRIDRQQAEVAFGTFRAAGQTVKPAPSGIAPTVTTDTNGKPKITIQNKPGTNTFPVPTPKQGQKSVQQMRDEL